MSETTERTRRSVRLAREGWYFLFILGFIVLGSVLRQMNLLFMLVGLMITPLFLNWRFAISSVFFLRLKRRTNEVINAGQTSLVEWQLTNERTWLAAWNIKIEDRIRQVDPGDPKQSSTVEMIVPQVAGNETISSSYRVHLSQRGKYEMGPAQISTTFPLGLVRGSFSWNPVTELYVGPRLGQLTPTWHQRMQSLAAGNQSNQRRRGIEQDEFYALRPWTSGDSIRWIHWRSSAKFGELTVKQFDQKGDRDFALLLDCFIDDPTNPITKNTNDSLDDNPDLKKSTSFVTNQAVESALSCTATILSELEHWIKGQVAVSFCGQNVWTATTQAYSQFLSELMRRLAVIRPTNQTRFEQGMIELASSVSAGTPIIVISTRPRPEWENGSNPMLEAAVKRSDWIEVGTDYFKELFQFDDSQRQRELETIFNHQKFVESNPAVENNNGSEAP